MSTIPPVPVLKIEDASQLKVGDVVRVDVTLKDRETGAPFTWRRFACVTRRRKRGRLVEVVTLKMRPDADKDIRVLDVEQDGVYRYIESMWPDGVVAMRVKLIHTGWIKLT